MASGLLTRIFAPRSNGAVIAASHDPAKSGYGLARNLVHSNYQGAVRFVNPKGGRLLRRPVYSSIVKVPEPVDLAILLNPTRYISGVLKEWVIKGVKTIVIGSGPVGFGRQARLVMHWKMNASN